MPVKPPELDTVLKDIAADITVIKGYLEPETARAELERLKEEAGKEEIWSDPKKAADVMRAQRRLETRLDAFAQLETAYEDIQTLCQLAEEEADQDSYVEALALAKDTAPAAARAKIEYMFSGEADGNDTFLEIHAGAGGTESQDWADMLLRMYLRWCEKRGFKTEILHRLDGEEAGVKSVTLQISGDYAYGWLAAESGIHRLVRISPFDSAAKRHTSFSSVWVYPVVDDNITVEIEEKDLRVDTYRASGAGGQHVNKTDSAIRITHIPTNIVVQCQDSRSQHQNRAAAMNMLKSRLYEAELQKRDAEKQALSDSKTDIGWGHQIRSYVMQPYQMVKDLRSRYENPNVQAVMDGDLDGMLTASLLHKASAV